MTPVSSSILLTTLSDRIQDSPNGGRITCSPRNLTFNKFRYGDPVSNCWKNFTTSVNAAVKGGQTISWPGYATSIPGVDDPCPGVPKVIEYNISCI